MRICLTGRLRFAVLCCSAIGSAIGFAALQEGVWRVPDYKFGGYMTLLTALTMAVCGQLERMLTCDTSRRGPLLKYVQLSLLTLAGMYFTNQSLQFLNYPTRVIFKSSKLVPTMIMGTILQVRTSPRPAHVWRTTSRSAHAPPQGRRYSALEYVAAAGLIFGIILFTMGDAEVRPSFHPAGIGLIALGVAADAATSNFEEKAFFRVAEPASQPEVVTFSSLFGSVWAALLLLPIGENVELAEAIEHSRAHPSVLPLLVASAVCGYVSVSFVLLLINLYGATVTEMVKSMRKVCFSAAPSRARHLAMPPPLRRPMSCAWRQVLTVLLSFVLYPKPFSTKYILGGIAVVVSLLATHELQRRKGGDVQQSAPPKIAPVKRKEKAAGDSEVQPLASADETDVVTPVEPVDEEMYVFAESGAAKGAKAKGGEAPPRCKA